MRRPIGMALFGMVWLLRVRSEMKRCAKCRRESIREKQLEQLRTPASCSTFFTIDAPTGLPSSETLITPERLGPTTYCEVHGFNPPKEDIQEFYELTLLDENKSVQEKTAETIRIANKWEANDGPIIPAYTNNEAIARWKCKVKSKAAAYKQEQLKTGAGPCLAQPLNDVEARLMNIYGWRSLSGDGNNEFFFKKGKENLQVEVQPPAPLAPLPPLHIPAPGPVPAAPVSAAAPAPVPPVASTSRETQPKRKTSSCLQSHRSKRFVSMNRMHNEHIDALKEINKIDFKRLVDRIISKNL